MPYKFNPLSGKFDYYESTSYTTNTESNILGSTPAGKALAFGTDTERFYFYDESDWRMSEPFWRATSGPPMGYRKVDFESGYGDTFVSDKSLHHISLGDNDGTDDGDIKYVDDELLLYRDSLGAYASIPNTAEYLDDDDIYKVSFTPKGYDNALLVSSRSSDDSSLNGAPGIQYGVASMGPNAVPAIIDGGTN